MEFGKARDQTKREFEADHAEAAIVSLATGGQKVNDVTTNHRSVRAALQEAGSERDVYAQLFFTDVATENDEKSATNYDTAIASWSPSDFADSYDATL